MAVEQRYRVTERLEAGGMAEVFRGESVSVQGFKKQVAIKRVLPHLGSNKNFISMFLDEARLGARLAHANIVTVFDIGAADNTFFIVMEFIDGCNLKAVIEEHRNQGRRIGVKEAVFITMEACKGLSFAHEVEDDDGNDLHIVHRDISPPNILISKRGEVKVTDFGLAKATTQLEKTDPGVVKGKFSYLSPEAALAQPVDLRTDIYALGIVLWEMLAGRRLYLGETDYQTVKMVQQSNVPSLSRINPEVDPELERIINQALEKDLDKRFQNARDFGDALAQHLYSRQQKVTSYDIATLVKWVLESKKKAKAGQKPDQSIIDRLIQEELIRFTSLDEQPSPTPRDSDSGDKDGAAPLDAGLFENPADWFRDDNDVHKAIATQASEASRGPRWAETGSEEGLSDLLEDSSEQPLNEGAKPASKPARVEEKPRTSAVPEAAKAPSATEATEAPATLLKTTPADAKERPQESAPKSNAAIYALVGIALLLGAGAAAYFGGLLG